jgi:formamidopyrimidine-DNA glycosylase
VVFRLEDGELRYRNMRKLGGIWLAPDSAALEEVIGHLGPNADDVDRALLGALLERRRGGVKAALMDQRLLAGLGNELVDDILWRAGLHPRARIDQLDEAAIDALQAAIDDVLGQAVPRGGTPSEGWLRSQRGEPDPRCPRCGSPLRRATVAGRTTYWCPSHQPDP